MAGAAADASVASYRRRLIVCCDGTTNDGINTTNPLTNVARISRCVKSEDDRDPDDRVVQIVYYQTGVGTGTSQLANVVDSVYGRGLNSNIREAYTFLCQNYASKRDEVILVGFSRGAFTARALAKLIDDVGILRKSGLGSLRKIFDLWKAKHLDSTEALEHGWGRNANLEQVLTGLRVAECLHRYVQIRACAVWDTVAALSRNKLGFVNEIIPSNVELAVQALALDEVRSQFAPLLWRKAPWPGIPKQDLRQCWFLGTHSDIGGGTKGIDLANISLAWMIAQLRDRVAFSDGLVNRITDVGVLSPEAPEFAPTMLERGEGSYLLNFNIAVEDFEKKTNMKVSAAAKVQRLSGWALRQPFTSGSSTCEQLHWSVRPLQEKGIIRQSAALSRVDAAGHETRQTGTSPYEHNMLGTWVARQCLRFVETGILRPNPPEVLSLFEDVHVSPWKSRNIELEMGVGGYGVQIVHALRSHEILMVPLYAVLWNPSQWTLGQSHHHGSRARVTVDGRLSMTDPARRHQQFEVNNVSFVEQLPRDSEIKVRTPLLREHYNASSSRLVPVLTGSVTIPFIGNADPLDEAFTFPGLQYLEDLVRPGPAR